MQEFNRRLDQHNQAEEDPYAVMLAEAGQKDHGAFFFCRHHFLMFQAEAEDAAEQER